MSAPVRTFTAPYATRQVPREGLVLLDRNEGLLPPATLLAALDGAVDALRRYPDARPLEAALAHRFGITSDRVLVTAGADDAIDRCCRAFLSGRALLTAEPTFEMLLRYAATAGAPAVTVPWEEAFPTAGLVARLGAAGMVAVVSPNNPTGCTVTPDDLTALARATGGRPILLDHAYVEYADDDLTLPALALPNVIVVRTFSKAWGLAGCRVGYALGPVDLIRRLRIAGAPYAVAAPSLALALARLESGDDAVRTHVARVRLERDELSAALRRAGVESTRSQANFVLGRFGGRARQVYEGLLARGILVRDFTNQLPGALRISLPGDEAVFERLMLALATVLTVSGGPS